MENTENIVEQYLESLGKIKAADTTPGFYDRLISRMNNNTGTTYFFAVKPAFTIATLLLFLSLNITAIYWYKKEQHKSSEVSLSLFAETYFDQDQTFLP